MEEKDFFVPFLREWETGARFYGISYLGCEPKSQIFRGSGAEPILDTESFVSFLVSRLTFKQSTGLFKSHPRKVY